MTDYEGKTNNEILLEIKQMQIDHENLKAKMLTDYDKLIEIEEKFMLANKIITERLKGQKTISPQTPNVIESNSNKEG
jgi:hypothetical protein